MGYTKRSLVLLVALLVWSTIGAHGRWVAFDGVSVPGSVPEVTVIRSNGEATVLRVRVPGMEVADTMIGGDLFQRIAIPGTTPVPRVGAPEVPAVRRLVGLPPSGAVEISAERVTEHVVTGYQLYPFQVPPTDRYNSVPHGTGEPTEMDPAIYAVDREYPAEIAETGEPAIWRDMRVVNVALYPVRANPFRQELHVCSEVILRLDYRPYPGSNPLPREPRPIGPDRARIYRHRIVNFDALPLQVRADPPQRHCLVIVPDTYYPQIEPLVEWKNRKGTETRVVRTSELEAVDTTYVKQCILADYEERHTDYVILVADHAGSDSIPFYTGYSHPAGGTAYGDHWYSLIDGYDDYPDLIVARFPAHDTADVTTMVEKITAYERTPDPAWFTNHVLLWAHKEGYPYQYTKCKRTIGIDIIGGVCRWDTLFGGAGATDANVIEGIEQHGGCGILNYRGHGRWHEYPEWNTEMEFFDTLDIAELDNEGLYPILFDISCSSGMLPSPPELLTLGRAWMRRRGGGVASDLTATRPTYRSQNDKFDQELFRQVFTYGTETGGLAMNAAKIYLLDYYGGDIYTLANVRIYYWAGDPELPFWTERHRPLEVEHPVWVPLGESTVTVIVRSEGAPLEDGLVCLWKAGEVHQIAYTDGNGGADFEIATSAAGVLHVTVTASNHIPYEGLIHLAGLFGPSVRADASDTSNGVQPSAQVDGVGKVYLSWVDRPPSGPHAILFSRSDDGGNRFWAEPVTALPGWGPCYGPSLAVDPGGDDVGIAVSIQDTSGADGLWFTGSSDGGETFGLLSEIAGGWAYAQHPSLARGWDGGLYVAWEQSPTGNSDIYFTFSTDHGMSWSPDHRLLSTGCIANEYTPSLKASGSERVYAVWQMVDLSEQTSIVFRRSTDGGLQWEESVVVVEGTADTSWSEPAMAVGSSELDVYVSATCVPADMGSSTIVLFRSTDGGSSFFRAGIASDEEHGDVRRSSVAVPSDGVIWVVWEQAADPPHIAVSRSTDGGSSFSFPTYVDDLRGCDATSPTLAVRSEGDKAVVAWASQDDGDSQIRLAKAVPVELFMAEVNPSAGAPGDTIELRTKAWNTIMRPDPEVFTGWVDIYWPDGKPVSGNPFKGPAWIHADPYEVVGRRYRPIIPAWTEPGIYTVAVRVGPEYGDVIWDSEYLEMEVVPGEVDVFISELPNKRVTFMKTSNANCKIVTTQATTPRSLPLRRQGRESILIYDNNHSFHSEF
jgi:hypothetical protein